MLIYQDIHSFITRTNAIVTSGTFDGVHIGHQTILDRLINTSKATHGESVVLTFWPHPRAVLQTTSDNVTYLSTLEEKLDLLEKSGVDHTIVIPFTKEFSELSSQEFIESILINKIGTKTLVIGYDHRFGKNREGGFDYLQKHIHLYPFNIVEIPKFEVDQIGISSTLIRNSIITGDISTANKFLGRNYSFSGKVVDGDKLGRTIGYPTANIELIESNKLLPADGVYAVKIHLEDEHLEGMMYIGIRPTLNGTMRKIEVNIFNFDKQIYNADINIELLKQVRGDMKFESIEALKMQIGIDKTNVLQILNNK